MFSRRVVVLSAVGVLGVLGLLGLVANAALSRTYGPESVVRAYFAAQQRGDVSGMWANANFERPDGAYEAFFGRLALAGMMKVKANSNLRDISVGAPRRVDFRTQVVRASMTWEGKPYSRDFKVQEDHSQSHLLVYPYFRIQIPTVAIRLHLPNQAALINLDGTPAPRSSQDVLDSIMGFHQVTMDATGLLNGQDLTVDARQDAYPVTVPGTLQDARMAELRVGIRKAFEDCDPTRSNGCINHTYTAPDSNFIYYLDIPGAGRVAYTKYVETERGDPAADVSVTIEPGVGIVRVHGTCAETLTIDGSRHFQLKGDYGGTMRWDSTGFYPDIMAFNCHRDKG